MEGRIPAWRPVLIAAPEPYPGPVAGVGRRFALPLAFAAAAVVLAITAVVDHSWKQRRINHAEVAEWYCAHEGTRCGGPSSERIEAAWNRRQLGYEIGASSFGALGVAVAVARLRRR
jgi:hypothetical protein